MELIGARCVNETTDADGVFLEIAPLTVLYGPNDAGKSRLLRSIAGGLGNGSQATPHTTRLYYEMARWQANRFLKWCCTDLNERLDVIDDLSVIDGEIHPVEGVFEWKDTAAINAKHDDAGLYMEWRLADRTVRLDTSVAGLYFGSWEKDDSWGASLIRELRGISGLDGRDWDPLFETLSASRRFAFEPASDGAGTCAYWCLPPRASLDPDVEALALNLYPRGWPTALDEPVPFLSASIERYHADGLLDVVELPRQFAMEDRRSDTPLQLGRLTDAIARSCAQAARSLAQGEWVELLKNPPSDVRPTDAAHRTFETLIEDALPGFVSGRYSPVSTQIEDSWTLELLDRETGRQFAAKDVAEGYRSWVRLSVDVATRALHDLANLHAGYRGPDPGKDRLFAGTATWTAAFVELSAEDADRRRSAIDVLRRAFAAAQEPDEEGYTQFGEFGPFGELSVGTVTGGQRPIAYLLDEPERNLHPALQRQAASWLARTMTDLGATALIATHSTTFLDLDPEAVTFNRVLRPANRATSVARFAPRALRLTDDLALTMGLTRGELVTLRRGVLLVEGPTDAAFLDGYAGVQLREAGFVTVPMHGGKRATHAVNALFEGVLAFASLRTILLLDQFSTDELRGLSPVDGSLAKALKGADASAELLWAAKAADAATEAGIDLIPYGIGVKDIFMLTSDATVRTLKTGKATAKTARFPGHTAAYEGESDWKSAYRNRWGLDLFSEDLFRQAGEAMARHQERIPVLDQLLAEIARAD